jgi:DNA-binding MarR family transcriptional regulator
MAELTDEDYRRLLEFRDGVRRYLHHLESQAGRLGITPAQHQILLAVRGHPGPKAPSIRELSTHMLLRHHSMVELIDRAERAGLVQRWQDPDDHRVVRVALTKLGNEKLHRLSAAHMDELSRLIPRLRPLLDEEFEDAGPNLS